ncbi:hypothetical protein CLOSTMETH_03620 [[Clostridium] methylpentosum DSM 5476]|uniref:Uncharacterized protein n=1 Tax=[Clostridium] methylpentosum DSM 5476 TaxID=537013 RepID=C0EIC5_9FIRM|nr:hypothetical protein CLOSTMETH_03620 [[Clostridium] methylpentosum DSM 5476]
MAVEEDNFFLFQRFIMLKNTTLQQATPLKNWEQSRLKWRLKYRKLLHINVLRKGHPINVFTGFFTFVLPCSQHRINIFAHTVFFLRLELSSAESLNPGRPLPRTALLFSVMTCVALHCEEKSSCVSYPVW